MVRTFLAALLLVCASAPASHAFTMPDDEAAADFVASNVIATFYHEVGHALIDVLGLPVLGREEDAADALSALLTHQIWEEDSAAAIINDTANAYLVYADLAESEGYETPYWDEHSLDLQRYYNLVCLFYGADPERREFIVTDYELPQERAEQCPAEFEQTEASWSGLLQEASAGGQGLVMKGDASDPLVVLLADEVKSMNELYDLPQSVTVEVADCGEANAFYDSEKLLVTICTEYAADLAQIFQSHLTE